MECAQYLIRTLPGSRLLPLSMWADPWETAQEEAARNQALADLGTAFFRIPGDSVRRIANGVPRVADIELADQEMPAASLALISGGSGAATRAEAIKSAAQAKRPSPVQDIAWMAVRERGLSHRNPDNEPPSSYHPPPQLSSKAKLCWTAGSSLVSLILGIVLASYEPDTAPGAATPIGWGIFLILLALAIPVIAVIVAVAWDGARRHRAWLDSKPPSQQVPIVQAEKAALWAATAAAAVAMHESNKRNAARHRAQQAARQRAYQGQQRHEELLAAVRQSGQSQGADPMTAATVRTLARSAARRRR